ncbi:DUF5693 family protein [Paenibacillus beijingensis]|uniref:Uncharacterized protein n=1 Tax=Paenibacillus beijingensis TaxID=1126833 RepID=A0A0D5NGY0_9BACL|nr:DUF5693 family protein [Paenibacillus beijingensis]AJY74541.1 hypothetical protein VN24_08105 [Paenibacillus beijingensis]
MLHSWQQWNRAAKRWLWALTLIGVIAAIPLGATRWQMEKTSKQIEYVFDYSDLVQIASYQAQPAEFMAKQLERMKQAGIGTMSVYESRLDELETAGRLTLYDEREAALMQNRPLPAGQQFTYLLFAGDAEQAALQPLIERTFSASGIAYRAWTYAGQKGLVLETPFQNAVLKTMPPDPLALQTLHEQGFRILPRLSDRIRPYNQADTDAMLAEFKSLGVSRILFDGDAVKGFNDNADLRSLYGFGELLNKYGIGITAIEGLKKPQQGLNTLAYLTHYNVTRLYSLSDRDAAAMKPDAIVDRFLLAAKDRSIRMFYLNGAPSASLDKGGIVDPLDNLYKAIGGPDGAVQKLSSFGFPAGQAEPFERSAPGWNKYAKMVVCLGAVSLIALLVGAFFENLLLAAFALGLLGSAALYVLSTSILEQGLALGAGISAPTLGLIWAMNRVRAHTDGPRRYVGAGDWAARGEGGAAEADAAAANAPSMRKQIGLKWIFPGLSPGRRMLMAIMLFIVTALISMIGIPFVFGLLNNITYSLVLQQFRGVSLLHLAPIALVALYIILFTGQSAWVNLRKLLAMNITVLWVAAAGILGVAGLYYLSRTGNAGTASALELMFRNALEQTFGVRPRTKEFLLAHPVFLLGLFLALRYRAAWVLLIVGSIGQLSMVDTFAHIHTPLHISLIRILLGLGFGAVIGIVLIGIWQLAEAVWRRSLWKHVPKSGA